MPKKNQDGIYGLCNGCGNARCRECGGRRNAQLERQLLLKAAKTEAQAISAEVRYIGKDLGRGMSEALSELVFGSKQERKKSPFW